MALTDLMTSLQNTIINAQDWDEFINGNTTNEVVTRLNIKYPTLPRLIQIMLDKLLTFEMRGAWQSNTIYHIKDMVTFDNVTYVATVEHTANDFNTDLNSGKWAVYQLDLNKVIQQNQDFAPVLGSPVKFKLNPLKASLLYGISDPTHLDDNLNNYRGLNNQDAWHDSNIPIGAVAFGRNNAPFAYLSTALGHDCVTYGVASIAGGAGTATGNPDIPSDGANYGYCAIAWGKDSVALGRISHAFGERVFASSIHSEATGYDSIASRSLTSHPNGLGGDGLDNDGNCAIAKGYRAKAYGVCAVAIGYNVISYNNAMTIGRGIDDNSPLINAIPDALALGMNTRHPTVLVAPGDGEYESFGKLGINTVNPQERVDINVKTGDTISVAIPTDGNVNLDFKAILANNTRQSLFKIKVNNLNSGQAYGTTEFSQNSNKFLTVNEQGVASFEKPVESKSGFTVAGKRVVGGQLPAIADSTGTASDNARAINAILSAMRAHGLIAS